MNYVDAIILGVVQGLTEFLPISSSGHLVIFQKMLGIEIHDLLFDVIVHLATVFVIIVFYRNVLLSLIKGLFQISSWNRQNKSLQLIQSLFIGTLPAVIFGLLFNDKIEQLFSHTTVVGYFFLFTGVVLFLTKIKERDKQDTVDEQQILVEMSWKHALIIGLAQALAMAPGISRAGMTIAVALFIGIVRPKAAQFSFLLAIPVICGATLLHIMELDSLSVSFDYLFIGFLSAAISGWVGLNTVLKTLKDGKLFLFSIYLWILGFAVVFWA